MEKIEQKKIILPFIIGSLFLIFAAWGWWRQCARGAAPSPVG